MTQARRQWLKLLALGAAATALPTARRD